MEKNHDLQELTSDELTSLTGGGFAYDLGYSIRFLAIAGSGLGGPGFAISDYFLNYKPR